MMHTEYISLTFESTKVLSAEFWNCCKIEAVSKFSLVSSFNTNDSWSRLSRSMGVIVCRLNWVAFESPWCCIISWCNTDAANWFCCCNWSWCWLYTLDWTVCCCCCCLRTFFPSFLAGLALGRSLTAVV